MHDTTAHVVRRLEPPTAEDDAKSVQVERPDDSDASGAGSNVAFRHNQVQVLQIELQDHIQI